MEEIKLANAMQELKKIKDNSIDLIVTDPPYKVTKRGSAGNVGGMLKKELTNKGKIFKHNDIDINEYAKEFYRVLKDKSHCYVMTNNLNLIEYLNVFTNSGFKFTKSLIWNKGNKIMSQSYMSQFEYILFFKKNGHKKINFCGTSDILEIPNKKTKDENGKNIHDTEKPIELMEILIKNSSNENDLVLDPFAGSGSTALACINLNRKFISYEIDETYQKIANERITKHLSIDKLKEI